VGKVETEGVLCRHNEEGMTNGGDALSQGKTRQENLLGFVDHFLVETRAVYQGRLGTNKAKAALKQDPCVFLNRSDAKSRQDGVASGQVCTKTRLCAMPFYTQNDDFCQDRLGTNIGKAALKQRDRMVWVFLQRVHLRLKRTCSGEY
jgi:hypothetical protein